MDPVAILLILIVLGFVILYVTRPFFERPCVRVVETSHELSSLLAEHERLLTALQELDFDQTLGKIPEEDYPIQRAVLLQKGADVLRQLDALTPTISSQAGSKVHLTVDSPKPAAQLSDDDLEDLLAKRRNSHKDKTAGFCPSCGKPVLRSDVFCSSCGRTLK